MTAINLKKYIEDIASIKNQASIEAEVSEELSHFGIFEEVTELPTGDNINPNKIYFIPNEDEAENDEYDIYAYIDGDWEKLDSSANVTIDTEGFITVDELNYALSTKSDVGHGHDVVTDGADGFITWEQSEKLDGIEEEATKNVASDNNPLMDGTASAGVSDEYSRADHIHPSDTGKADAEHTHDSTDITDIPDMSDVILKSETSGLVRNDGTIDTSDYLTSEDIADIGGGGGGTPVDLSNYIQKSETSGLVKNDGTIDTNQYIQKSQTSGLMKNDGTVDTKHYVEEVNGKGLSTNDFTDELMERLDYNYAYIDDDLRINFIKIDDLVLTSTNNIIQSGEKSHLQVEVTDSNGEGLENVRVDFYEIFTPTLTLSSPVSIIQSGERADITAKLKDADGSLVVGERIDFYEIFTPTLLMSSDKDIIQSSQVADIKCKVKDEDGSLVSNQVIYFYVKESESSYRYMGKGVTDNTGVAHLTEDANGGTISGYTGTGSGKLDIVTSSDKPIKSDSVVSDPYNVFDCIQVDDDTDTNTNFWNNYSNASIVNRDGDKTHIEYNQSSNTGYILLNRLTTSKDGKEWDWNGDFCFEFDLIDRTNEARFQFLQADNIGLLLSCNSLNLTGGHKYSLNFRLDGTLTVYQDGVQYGDVKPHSLNSPYRFAWVLGSSMSVTFKNFKIYPI